MSPPFMELATEHNDTSTNGCFINVCGCDHVATAVGLNSYLPVCSWFGCEKICYEKLGLSPLKP